MKRISKYRLSVNWIICIIVVVISSLLLTRVAFGLQHNFYHEIKECIVNSGYMIFYLNFFPVLLLTLFIYFATNNLIVSGGVVWLVVCALSYINKQMVVMRQAPLRYYDLVLAGEFLNVAKSMDKSLFIIIGVGLSVFAAIFTFCFICVKSQKMNIYARLAALLVTGTVIIIFNNNVLSDDELYKEIYMQGNIYNETDNYGSKGFVYSFIHNFNTSKIEKPVDYDKNLVTSRLEDSAAVSAAYDKQVNKKKPHIIMIMSEAFSDILINPALDYTGYTDPLKHFKAIRKESVSGQIVVPNMGGGTSDTEFDVLTGISTRHFKGVPYTYSAVAKNVDSLPSALANIGYESIAVHPGAPWFYNRQNAYRFLGFNEFIDINSFDAKKNKGVYMSETATYDMIIDIFDRHVKSSEYPLFEFCVTIQNHGPYINNYESDINFNTEFNFTKDEMISLSNYIVGAADADRELHRLVEYLRGLDEPVVLVYFGDHLPSLSIDILTQLIPWEPEGTVIGSTRFHKTPFIIWQNNAAKTLVDINEVISDYAYPQDMILTSNYLGAAVLELIGFAGIDPFMDYVNELRALYPIIYDEHYFTADGQVNEYSHEKDTDISLYRMWEYYNLFEK